MFDIEIDNIFAIIIFIVAMAGIIGLTAYKMHKKNNGITLEAFLAEYYEHIISVLQDVVSILLVNVEDYPDKESYEKDIIRLTIEKLDENCEEFGIDVGMLKLVNKDALAEGIHKILTAENVTVFTSTVPKQIMEDNKELYDENVLEIAEVLDAVNDQIKVDNESVKEAVPNTVDDAVHDAIDHILNYNPDEVNEEYENVDEVLDSVFEEAEEIAEEALNYGIKVEPNIEDNDIIAESSEEKKLPPRETYYGEKKEKIATTKEDIENAEWEFPTTDIDYAINTVDQLADLAKPNNDVDSISSSDIKIAEN